MKPTLSDLDALLVTGTSHPIDQPVLPIDKARPRRALTKWLPVATLPPMTTVSIKDAKNRLTELARLVDAGERVTVTRHGKPVFDMVPPAKKRGGIDFEAAEAYLKSKGIVRGASFISDDFDDPIDPEDFVSGNFLP